MISLSMIIHFDFFSILGMIQVPRSTDCSNILWSKHFWSNDPDKTWAIYVQRCLCIQVWRQLLQYFKEGENDKVRYRKNKLWINKRKQVSNYFNEKCKNIEILIGFAYLQTSKYSEVPNRRADRNKWTGLEKRVTLLAYLLSKVINEQGGFFSFITWKIASRVERKFEKFCLLFDQ